MIIPIKCFTCGTILANKYRYFCEEVRKRKLTEEYNLENVRKEKKGKLKTKGTSESKRDDFELDINSKSNEINRVLYLTPNFQNKTPEGEVLDEIGLTKMCCRRHMLSHVDIY